MADKEKISPGMQQYLDIKAQYPDAFLLFRMGDFYELFFEDALTVAPLLELTLTSRNKTSDHPVPMAGVPHHAVGEYVDKLVGLGYKVAIADQLEDPKDAKGIVKRGVTQVITPGTTTEVLAGNDNNFLVAVDRRGGNTHKAVTDKQWALAYMDVSTGEFKATELADFATVVGEVSNLRAREIVTGCELTGDERAIFEKQLNVLVSEQLTADLPKTSSEVAGAKFLEGHFSEKISDKQKRPPRNLSALTELEKQVALKLLAYVHRTQLRDLSHIQKAGHYELADFLQMDHATKSALELTANKREGKKFGTLYALLDATKTAMGTRMLKSWIERPLIDKTSILKRQEMVQLLLTAFMERADLIESLKGIYDLERLASRVSFGKAMPVDLIQLKNSLAHVPAIQQILAALANDTPSAGELFSSTSEPSPKSSNSALSALIEGLDALPELSALIEASIDPSAMHVITEGGIIKENYSEQLDKYREALSKGTTWIADIEAKERAATGIGNLRIDFNRKDGYYFHVTQSQLSFVPDYFFRKATLKNSERYGTKELSEIEETMFEAREKSAQLEYSLFLDVRSQVETYISRLQALAKIVAEIDCLQALSIVAEKHHYVCPELTAASSIAVKNGRHAVVEAVMKAQEYVPNDVLLPVGLDIQLITGPNMSGKSTYMRQLALLVIMTQIGSFVPADSACLPIFDAIFTRIGASDDLTRGESTFMVEMSEANRAIQHATAHSLILFDELGRGTATYDGMALAQAIIEYIHDHIGAKTLFATHYHELTVLDQSLSGLTNVHVATLERGGEVTFLHKITEGPADKSYGIHVAKIAGLPEELLTRADVILQKLENHQPELTDQPNEQLELFTPEPIHHELTTALEKLDISNMTPLEALNALSELTKLL